MSIREKFLTALAALVTKHPGKVLICCALMTCAMLVGATRLGMKTQFAEMLPDDIPKIREYLDIVEEYASDATVMITLESPEKDVKRMHRAAEDLAARLSTISLVKPSQNSKLTLNQKIALLQKKFPAGIDYDTINLVRRVDYKIDNDFIAEHGFIIQKTKDLENSLNMFSSLSLPDLIGNINSNFEREYIEDSENLTTIDGEAQAVQGLEGIRKFLQSMETYISEEDSAAVAEAVSEFVSGPSYFLSPDNTVLLMMLHPSVSLNEFEDAMYLGYRIDDTLGTMQEKYPDLAFGRTGLIMMQIDENNALAKDFSWPSVIAIGLILVLLIGSFGTWKNPFLTVVTLITGLVWTTGILALTFQYLNMMSAGFGIVLIGLGIDFGIHFISGFRDGQEQNMSVSDSIYYMYNRVGAGVITGALTTAIVFFCLPLTRFEAYAQMGLVTGIGIITMLVAQMILLPALIVWDNKGYSVIGNVLRWLRLNFIITIWNRFSYIITAVFRLPFISTVCHPLKFGFLSATGRLLNKVPIAVTVLVVAAVLIAGSIVGGLSMEWEYDLMKMSPQDTPSQRTQNIILDKFEMSPDYAIVKARDLEDCRRLVEEFKKVGNRTGLIGSVDAISEFIPEESVQLENALLIAGFKETLSRTPANAIFSSDDFKRLKSELTRLHQNIVEIGEMSIMSNGENNKIIHKCDQITGKSDEDSYILNLTEKLDLHAQNVSFIGKYQEIAAMVLKQRLMTMAGTDPVTLENIPETIRKRYVNEHNSDLLINVYPKGYIWDEKNLSTFNEQTSKVTERTTGMPAITQLLMDLMAQKGRDAIILGAIAILAFLLIDFRSIRYTLLAAIPLATGAIWMVGLMAVTGMKLSLMNFMAIPLIIGIGIDDAVHILHRYRIEGRGSMPMVLKYTGRAILLTSLTTMIGFGSMGTATHAGIALFGLTLFYGVGTCFVSSAYVLPSIITLSDKLTGRKKKSRKTPENQHTVERGKQCLTK